MRLSILSIEKVLIFFPKGNVGGTQMSLLGGCLKVLLQIRKHTF